MTLWDAVLSSLSKHRGNSEQHRLSHGRKKGGGQVASTKPSVPAQGAVYHGTRHTDRIKKILKEGIKTLIEVTGESEDDLISGDWDLMATAHPRWSEEKIEALARSRVKSTFFTDSLEKAMEYAIGEDVRQEGIVLRVEVPKGTNVIKDELWDNAFRVEQNIPPEWITGYATVKFGMPEDQIVFQELRKSASMFYVPIRLS